MVQPFTDVTARYRIRDLTVTVEEPEIEAMVRDVYEAGRL